MVCVKKCCCCVDLRIGCIALAIVGIILSIIGVGLFPSWSSILGLILALIANGCLLFAAAYTQGTAQIRSILVLVYVVFTLLCALILFIGAILLCVVWGAGDWDDDEHAILATATIIYFIEIGFYVYFAFVACGFYQEIKGAGGGGNNVEGQVYS